MTTKSSAPIGVAETCGAQNDVGVPNVIQPTGWRKATVGLVSAERHALVGENAAIPKTRAFVAIKRVGAHIGLKAGDMLLLDTLGAFTQPQDWDEGQRPIVWVSNAYLMDQTGFSLSTLKRHARRLAETGVISFKDSPNGKRWGRRDANGLIVEAYGFDLSPLSARAEEFESLLAELQAERDLCQRLKRQITVSRRMIRARIEHAIRSKLPGPWAKLTRLLENLLNHLPRRKVGAPALMRILELFKELQDTVDTASTTTDQRNEAVENTIQPTEKINQETTELNPREVESEPHIQLPNQHNDVSCSTRGDQKPDKADNDTTMTDKSGEHVTEPFKENTTAFDMPTMMQACPEFASWAHNLGGYLRNWGDLHRIVSQLSPMIGITTQTWNFAQKRLGIRTATAALMLTFDKHCAGEVVSPNGYLRGIVRKAGAGELHLQRSFYGRLNKKVA